jgi:hypothetical protein
VSLWNASMSTPEPSISALSQSARITANSSSVMRACGFASAAGEHRPLVPLLLHFVQHVTF